MADISAAAGGPTTETDRGRILAIVVYGLYLAAFINGITAIIGVVLAYVGRGEARGTVYESHFSNAIAVFWINLLGILALCAATFGFIFGLVGDQIFAGGSHHVTHVNPVAFAVLPIILLGGAALVIWYLYRVIMGLVRALDAKPYR